MPTFADPRLRLAATLLSLQVVGQLWLDFELSIAQLLISLAVPGVIEVALTYRSRHQLVWPASALLTGNGVALLLRVDGTRHGDWWSLNGWWIYALTAGLGLLSKYVVRVDGRPLFNPSNVALTVCFLALGSDRVNPLDFWWAPLSIGLVIAYALIAAGAIAVTRPLGLLPVSIATWLGLAASLGSVAASGHCMTARWSLDPVCDGRYLGTIVTSPEILVFVLFMVTDPKTIPVGRVERLVFGLVVGLVGGVASATQHTEFGTKVAVIAALVAVCIARPLLERAPSLFRSRAPLAASVASLVLVAGVTGPALSQSTDEAAAVSQSAVVPVERPDVLVAADDLPSVELGDGFESIGRDIDRADAETMALDLVTDLAIEQMALEQLDVALAETALTGPRLLAARRAIRAARLDDRDAETTTYRLDTVRLVVVRDAPQAVPILGFEAIGTTQTTEGATEPLDTRLLVTEVNGVWLLLDELAPDG